MVKSENVESTVENESDKRKLITRAARDLFARLGWDKVTMNDIARQMGVSKASLYYYFVDKEALFRAVVQSEQDEFLEEVKTLLAKDRTACWLLQQYVELRHRLFQHLLNLGKLRTSSVSDIKPLFKDLLAGLSVHELEAIEQILKRGRDRDELQITSVSETASLFLNLMQGLRLRYAGSHHTSDDDDQAALREELLMFAKIFTNGLRKK
jgi:AcrR family transcriptional regulator